MKYNFLGICTTEDEKDSDTVPKGTVTLPVQHLIFLLGLSYLNWLTQRKELAGSHHCEHFNLRLNLHSQEFLFTPQAVNLITWLGFGLEPIPVLD